MGRIGDWYQRRKEAGKWYPGKIIDSLNERFNWDQISSNFLNKISGGMDQENLDMQEDFLNWQKWFAENSTQIRAEDLEAAGLSKTLAAGGGATAPGGMRAPQRDMGLQQGAMNMLMGVADIGRTVAQSKLLKNQADTEAHKAEGLGIDNIIKKTLQGASIEAGKLAPVKLRQEIKRLEQQIDLDGYDELKAEIKKELLNRNWSVSRHRRVYVNGKLQLPSNTAAAELEAEYATAQLAIVAQAMGERDLRIWLDKLGDLPSTWEADFLTSLMAGDPAFDAIQDLIPKIIQGIRNATDSHR
jgi:hypothetical protein